MSRYHQLVFVILFLGVLLAPVAALECMSEIFCRGPLLNTIQMSGLYNDSKTFVDMPARFPPGVILSNFAQLPASPTLDELQNFVDENFYPVGYDLSFYLPEDWQILPPFLQNIKSLALKKWAVDLNGRWLNLSRTFNHSFSCSECFSSIETEYPFIVAGGRFREFYYWDSYWITQGLMISGMYNSTWQMLQNFLNLVDDYSFVPNGGRIYYLDRSQPPLLTQMVHKYFQTTHNVTFLKDALALLDKEYDFWQSNHTVNVTDRNGENFTLSIYHSHNRLPRPEAYLDDVELAESVGLNSSDAGELFSQIATACESGWDFSSRWMNASQNLSTTITKFLIPVDLNSILYANELSLSYFHQLFNNPTKAQYYKDQAYHRAKGIYKILWDEKDNLWYDYDWKRGYRHKTGDIYPSSFTPLWAQAYLDEDGFNSTKLASIILQNSTMKVLTSYAGGVPTSLIQSGQQWDFPNAWPPLMYFLIEGINNVIEAGGDQNGAIEKLNADLIFEWIRTNYCGWNATSAGYMYEKYDVQNVGMAGQGGQYAVQNGFGWTNGVALYLLNNYGSELFVNPCE